MNPPPGPDICYLLGFCQTSGGLSSDSNLLFLAATLILGAVVLHRRNNRKT